MAQLLRAPTEPDVVKREQTKLTADAAAGTTVALTVENNDQFAANDYVVIGYEGSEGAELQQVASVTGTGTITVGTLKFAHKQGEPVTKYRYNKRKFYGATSKTGSYTELTGDGSPKDIQPDDPLGAVLEYSGSTYSFFKATYYNSQTGDETALADSEGADADESKRYASLYDIRSAAGMADNAFYSDAKVERKRKQAENEVNSVLFHLYELPLAEVPPIVQQITETLAAGYIMYEEFGSDGPGGKALGEARALIKAIKEGRQRLLASDGTELARYASVGTLDGYPDDSIDEGSADDRRFRLSDKF